MRKIKSQEEIRTELKCANARLTEIENLSRKAAHCHEDLLVYERKWKEQHGYIEALWWVLGSL